MYAFSDGPRTTVFLTATPVITKPVKIIPVKVAELYPAYYLKMGTP